jgi:kynurenine 3-monooxygenase
MNKNAATVIGAGPVGCVLSVLLARRGFAVSTYEKRPDMRLRSVDGGRSINLVLTRRGLRALELLGLREAALQLSVPVLGRMMHAHDGTTAYQPYGKDDSECNYSVSRARLNEFLLDAAERAGCKIHFEHELVDADVDEGWVRMQTPDGDIEIPVQTLFGADGGGSGLRRALVDRHGLVDSIEALDHGYKEMLFPAGDDGQFAMAGHALHIWPRGVHMLMGLANLDRSFTGTIYLAREGEDGFDTLNTLDTVHEFFEREYPDAIPQGLNCGFEDCAVLWELTEDGTDDMADVFGRFYEARKENADAIADMAVENFTEMRDKVGDERFLLAKAVERRIEQQMPELYRSRYATVMYSYNPYARAKDGGVIQWGILEELIEGIDSAADADMDRARTLITERLTPFYERHAIDLSF